MIDAEELGVTSGNVAEMAKSGNLDVRRLLDVTPSWPEALDQGSAGFLTNRRLSDWLGGPSRVGSSRLDRGQPRGMGTRSSARSC
jgi:hypothetical protein